MTRWCAGVRNFCGPALRDPPRVRKPWRRPAAPPWSLLSSLEGHPHAELKPARLAGARAHRAVEVEYEVRRLGHEEVLRVEKIEDVHRRLDLELSEIENPRDAQVEGRQRVVLSARVALHDGRARVRFSVALSGDAAGLRVGCVGARDRERLRLRRAVAVACVDVDLKRRLPEEPPLETVALVAVG